MIFSVINVPPQDINLVVQCIRRHSMPVSLKQFAPEIVCISNADAMSQIADPAYWFYYVFNVREMTFEEGKIWYAKLITDRWPTVIGPAKRIIGDHYKRALAMIEG